MSGRSLRTLPWRRAPLLLGRQPLVAAALLLSATVLGTAAATGPVYLSTIATASLHSAAAQACPEDAMPAATNGDAPDDNSSILEPRDNARLTQRFSAAYQRVGLPAARNVVWTPGDMTFAAATDAASHTVGVYTYSAPGATSSRYIDRLSYIGGSGLWLSDYQVSQTHLRPGMFVRVDGKRIRIVGTYRHLADPNDPSFQLARQWCSWHDIIVQNDQVLQAPPLFILVDSQSFAMSNPAASHLAWYSPVDVSTMSHKQAVHVVQEATTAERQVIHAYGEKASQLEPDTTFQKMNARAAHIQSGLGGAIVPIAVGSVVIAMLLVVGAGWFWVLRRRREVDLLVARGIGPLPLAAKAVLETAPWLITGCAAGFGLTLVLVRALAPAPQLDSAAVSRGALLVAGVAVVAALVIAVIGATRGREARPAHRSGLRWARFVPWELALIAAAVAIRVSTHGQGISVDDQGTVQLGPAVLAFPLLGLAGALLLIVRLLRGGMPVLRMFARRGRMGRFLAFTRVATSPAVALGVVVGVALPCGMLVYASGLQSSLGHSVTAKYQANLGAPHVLSTVAVYGRSLPLNGTGTQVSTVQQGPVSDSGQQVRILGVDPATFSKFAYVDDDEKGLVARLHGHEADGSLPAIVANPRGGAPISSVTVAPTKLPVHVIATLPVFPGLRDAYQPMVIVNRDALTSLPKHIERAEQVWTSEADYRAAAANLKRQHIDVLFELAPDQFVTRLDLEPVVWVLAYLRALALLIGLVAIAGLVFALGARTKRAAVAYVLACRMGVSRLTHFGSLLRELALLVGLGWALGSGLAEAGVRAVYRLLDTDPEIPPPPSFIFDGSVLAALGGACALLVLVAAGLAQLLADRADPARTMRTI